MNAIRVYKSEIEAICRQVSQKQFFNIEVGGDLYGLWADDGTPIVFLATGPGPMAEFSECKFHQDYQEIMRCEEYLFMNYGIQYLGDWHSHHVLGLNRPSSGDMNRIYNILKQPNRNKMIELIVTHEYSNTTKNEMINGFYYVSGKKPINIPIENLKTKTSLIRIDLFSKHTKINLMESIHNEQLQETKSSIYNHPLEKQRPNGELNNDHYEPWFANLRDKILKHLK